MRQSFEENLRSLADRLSRFWKTGQKRRSAKISVNSALVCSEHLENRELLTSLTWDKPDALTASFAPEGTLIANQPNTFNQTFSAVGTPAQLRRWVLDVFQTWSQYANINIGLVNDEGQAFGSAGETQGDKRFGDIRIGATQMSNDVLAVSIPHTGGAAGTWAGDIIFNSSFRPVSVAQFKAVAMHEIGHALGLDHSIDPASPMFPRNSPSTVPVPTAADIANLRALHGARIDRNELSRPNNLPRDATRMRDGSYDGTVPLLKYGDISSRSDVDYFTLEKVDLYSGPVTIRLRSNGLSLFQGKLSIVDRQGNEIASTNSLSPGGEVSLTIPTITRPVYLKVTSATGVNSFPIGRYALIATYDGINRISNARINDVVRQNLDFLRQSALSELFRTGTKTVYLDDLHTNDTITTATALKTAPGFADATRYEFFGTISDLVDADFYSITSPRNISAQTVLAVTIDAAEAQSLIPSLSIYNAQAQLITPTVLRNGNGSITLQIPNIVANQTYRIKVAAAADGSRYLTGNYSLKARFSTAVESQASLLQGVLTSASPRKFYEMQLDHTMIFNFALEATRNRTVVNPNIATQVTLYDSLGREVHRVVSLNDATRTTGSVLLVPGKYFVRVNANSQDGTPFSALRFRLLGSVVSNPVGPIGLDPTYSPPITSTLQANVTYTPPVVTPPPPLIPQSPTENPYVYVPIPNPTTTFVNFQDWYWYYGY